MSRSKVEIGSGFSGRVRVRFGPGSGFDFAKFFGLSSGFDPRFLHWNWFTDYGESRLILYLFAPFTIDQIAVFFPS